MTEWPEYEQAAPATTIPFVCECGNPGCLERLALTRAEYEAVRAPRFVMAPGHEKEADRVVERHVHYVVAQKDQDVRDIVHETDPRRDAEA